MSKAASPTRFSGELDHFYDPNFTAEISHKMRVPKRIKVDGDIDDDTNNHSHPVKPWNDKIEMHVPERILVIGEYLIFVVLWTYENLIRIAQQDMVK